MNSKLFAAVFSLLVFGILAAPVAKADVNGEMTFQIKGGPVEIPGRVLMPGEYTAEFEKLDNHIVLIRAADNRTIGLFLAAPHATWKKPHQAQVQLSEPSKTSPERLVGFYDPNLSERIDFIYPQSQVATRATAAPGSMGR